MTANHVDWTFRHWVGSAAEFHARDLEPGRGVWWCDVSEPALVLGSTQKDSDVDLMIARDMGLNIVHRRSGGGAVFVHPADSLWIDITIPRDDVLWTDDVSSSMLWLGDAFVQALSPWIHAETYRGVFNPGVDGRVVCFDSLAPGEVVSNGRKVVGISQRRGRDGARLQCVLYTQWHPEMWAPVFVSDEVRQHLLSINVATINASRNDIVQAVIAALSVTR